MKRASIVMGLLCAAMGAGVVTAAADEPLRQALVPSAVEQEVLSFEKRRCDAVLKRDVHTLADMMADDVTYVHASGLKQNKEQYLAYVAAGGVTYTSYQIEHPVVHVLGDAAVTHGVFAYEIGSKSPVSRGEMLYTAVYVRTRGKWQLASWEATPKSPQP
jgi:ketosteroid isomerase-like protein